MSVSSKSISPAILAALVLAACGGGSDGANTAVSGSPKQPSATQSSNGSASGNTAGTATGNGANGEGSGGTQPSAPSAPNGTGSASADVPPPSTGPTGTNPPAGAEVPFYSTDRVRGDALLTMLDAKAPVYSRSIPRNLPISPRWVPERMSWTTGRGGERGELPEGHPHVHVSSQIIYENSSRIPGNYVPVDDPKIDYLDGQYTPARGNYTLRAYSHAQTIMDISHDATRHFINAMLKVPMSAEDNAFTLGNTVTLETSVFSPSNEGQPPFDVAPFTKEITLTSSTDASFGKNGAFPANNVIKTWSEGENSVVLYWKPGIASREVDICWQMKIRDVLDRTQCSLWTLQSDWTYGQRFSGGGAYLEDRNLLPMDDQKNSRDTHWIVDAVSPDDIFHG